MVEILDSIQISLADSSPHFVNELHLGGIMADMSDWYFALRAYHETTPFLLSFCYIFQLLIIHQMTLVHSLNHLRIVAQRHAHQGHKFVMFFLITSRLRQYYHITMIAYGFKIF